MLFRKIGRHFSGMIHDYMFDEFLSCLVLYSCMIFESCSCDFMILRPVLSVYAH
jgi:hypothetical protein